MPLFPYLPLIVWMGVFRLLMLGGTRANDAYIIDPSDLNVVTFPTHHSQWHWSVDLPS